MKNFYTIALAGLSEADTRQVLQVLETPKLTRWSLTEGGNSDLLIVDVDSVWGHMDWLRAEAEGRRCAAYTQQESMRDCDLLLRKPLDVGALLRMLINIQDGVAEPAAKPAAAARAKPETPAAAPAKPAAEPPRAARPTPAARPTAPAPVAAAERQAAPTAAKPAAAASPKATPTPATTANQADATYESVAAMLLAGGIDTPILVKDSDGETMLFIDPGNHIYRAPPQLKPLDKLLSMSAAAINTIDAKDPQVQHAGPEQPIVRLLWFAALSASKGQLAPHLNPMSIWKLTRWPQIEREFPRHFRIATAMMKQAGNIREIATASKSTVEDVAGFINAYYIAGYVAVEGTEESGEAANSTANVLSRLRRTFTRGDRQATS